MQTSMPQIYQTVFISAGWKQMAQVQLRK